MNKKEKDFRIREQYGKFYVERTFTEWKAKRNFWGKLQPKKIVWEGWRKVDKFGNFRINVLGYYGSEQSPFKSFKLAKEFIKIVCKEPIYHYFKK